MTNHTPGPWAAKLVKQGTTFHVCEADGNEIATLDGNNNDAANANLIAAAPELLNALVAIVTTWEQGKRFTDTANEIGYARAAIAKAKGTK